MNDNKLKETDLVLTLPNNNHIKCAGKDCKGDAKHLLRIVLINKNGWFCKVCKEDLESNGLIDSIIAYSNTTEFMEISK